MKKTILTVCFFSLLIIGLMSCKQVNAPQEISGLVFDASMNNITLITTAGDTVNVSTMDADPTKVPGVMLDDSVKVTCQKENMDGVEVLKAVDLIVTVHSPYYYIHGSWVEPNPINKDEVQGFTLNEDGTATSINMATLQMKNWNLNDKVFILGYESIGNKQTIVGNDTLNVVKLNADSLVLSSSNGEIAWRLGRGK